MYRGSLEASRILEAFRRSVPGVYVRDYSGGHGYLTVCRGQKDIPWRDNGLSTHKVYRQVPRETLCSVPRGNVTASSLYHGLELVRPGWLEMARKIRENDALTYNQMATFQGHLGVRVWDDIRSA